MAAGSEERTEDCGLAIQGLCANRPVGVVADLCAHLRGVALAVCLYLDGMGVRTMVTASKKISPIVAAVLAT